jgi:ribosomal protein S18 acetylase RimI-like enzyme
MPIVRATEADLDALRRLFQSARYKFADFGLEDLPDLLAKSESSLGTSDGVLWGFLSLQTEERPVTLPPSAPSRSYLRSMALRGGYPPSQHVGPLLTKAVSHLHERCEHIQVITYGGERWVVNALTHAGFTVADQVQFYELPRPHRQLHKLPSNNSLATLHMAESRDLEPLAELDAAAFPPLWHFGHKDMVELLMRTRLQTAVLGDEIVGYTAAIVNSSEELQLARLAVHPELQGHGIGRQLLHDVVAHAAAEQFERIILNTQTDNEPSQYLYRSFGFRSTSKPVPVLAMTVGEPLPNAP